MNQINQSSLSVGSEDRPITVCFPYAGTSVGGSHFSSLGLVQNLDPKRYRVLVVPEVPDGKIARLFGDFTQLPDPAPPKQSFATDEAFSASKFASTLSGIIPRVRFLKKHGVDIVHTNDGRTHATWALAARLAGLPLVWHHRADPRAKGLRYLAPALASRVLTVSKFSLPKAKLWTAAHKSLVVHSPFDTQITVDRSEARQRLLQETGLPEDAILLGYFGSFINRKRPFLFVETIAELRKTLTRPVFGLMFGEAVDPEMDAKLHRSINELQMTDAVRIMGFKSPGHYWIAACDQLLVPATGEPLGRTLVEAMLVRTPVVATLSGGNPEALAQGTGVLVQPESAAALAEGVTSLLDNPDKAGEMVEKAQPSAQRRFSMKRHVDQVTSVYDDLLGS